MYRIGSAVARSEWEKFTAVQHIGFDGTGNLYILDAPGPEAGTRVVIVDPAGRHVKDFGRQGEGPGEFQWPRRMVVWADGRTLIEDVLHMGSHLFGPEGDFDRMVRAGWAPVCDRTPSTPAPWWASRGVRTRSGAPSFASISRRTR